jgi:hypothetical protein
VTDLFSKRHFEWLARFAAANLSPPQVARLADELTATNAAFKRTRFLAAVEAARAPDVVSVRTGSRIGVGTRSPLGPVL